MGKRFSVVAVAATLALLMLAGPVLAAPVVSLDANLTGEKEVPGPGDPNGTGEADLIVSRTQVCYFLKVEKIRKPLAAHIHRGGRNVAGPVVVTLKAPGDGFSSGCERISRSLSRGLRNNPSHYYVNVHNRPFPDGAIRGQLHR